MLIRFRGSRLKSYAYITKILGTDNTQLVVISHSSQLKRTSEFEIL